MLDIPPEGIVEKICGLMLMLGLKILLNVNLKKNTKNFPYPKKLFKT